MLNIFLFLVTLSAPPATAIMRQQVPGASTTQSLPDPVSPTVTYHPGTLGVTTPKLIHFVDSHYTEEARRKKITGVCVISLIVNVNGEPESVKVVRSLAASLKPKLQAAGQGLDDAAITAVQQYRFKPSTLDGKPVPVEIHVEVSYHLYPRLF